MTNRFCRSLLIVLLFVAVLGNIGYCNSNNNSYSVYYLNFKPESDKAWQNLAKLYTEKTGIKVKIETVANSQYQKVLAEKLAESNDITLFQIQNARSLRQMSDHCFDLGNSDLYKELINDAYAIRDSYGKVRGIAYAVESYGLIVNRELLEKAGYDIDDINNFQDLKRIAEDITARKKELGFSAFCSAGMDNTSDWRFKTHLANMPIYFEQLNKSDNKMSGKYLDRFKAVWDLYLNNSTCSPAMVGYKSIEDARKEFLSSSAVFYQNGSWEFVELTKPNYGFNKYQLAMIPIYCGVEGEENQGLCTGTENYWAVNKKASAKSIRDTLDFLYWCVTSKEGTEIMAKDMGFSIPFKNAAYSENIFVQQNAIYTAKGIEPVAWSFTSIPSEEWKSKLAGALKAYAENQTDEAWQGVAARFVDGW